VGTSVGLGVAEADLAAAVADDDQRAEAEATAALDRGATGLVNPNGLWDLETRCPFVEDLRQSP
jgi:hypothetical protein